MACLRFLTVLPLRPDFSLPRLNSCISSLTLLWAFGLYLRPEELFFADVRPREPVDFLDDELDLVRDDEVDFLPDVDELDPPRDGELLRAVGIGLASCFYETPDVHKGVC